jgi:hypothetical protein
MPAPASIPDSNDLWVLTAYDGRSAAIYKAQYPDDTAPKNGTTSLYVRSTVSGEWRKFTVPGSKPRIKMIDSWVMGTAISGFLARPGSKVIPDPTGFTISERNESPGADERARYQENYPPGNRYHNGRPSTDSVFGKDYLPGVLFLIDTRTGRYLEIRTGQGDSEILLVHNSTVYYRVNDSLFAASLQAESTGQARLLTQNAAVPDMHWAFWGR